MLKYIVYSVFGLFIVSNAQAQTDALRLFFETDFAFHTDPAYGQAYVYDYLPLQDYAGGGTFSSPGTGFRLDLGAQYTFSEHFDLSISSGYTQLTHDIIGDVDNRKEWISKPLSDKIPTHIDAKVIFHFLDFGINTLYGFRNSGKNRFFASTGLTYMYPLDIDMDTRFRYETKNIADITISDLDTADIASFFTWQLGLGYEFILLKNKRLCPSVGVDFGLTSISKQDNGAKPNFFSVGIKYIH